MTQTTLDKLDRAATILTNAFITDALYGYTTREDVDKVMKISSSSNDAMKRMIRADKGKIGNAFKLMGSDFEIFNVLKTPVQLNYLAGKIVSQLRPLASVISPIFNRG